MADKPVPPTEPAPVDAQKLWLAAKDDTERRAIVKQFPELAQIYLRAHELKPVNPA